MVAIISVDAGRTLALRPRGGGPTIRYEVGHGDLLVMGGSCQRRGSMRCRNPTGRSGTGSAFRFRPANVR